MEKGFTDFKFESFVCFDEILLQIGVCYSICHVGTHLTIKLQEIANAAYNIEWFSFPVNQQKLIASIMQQGQVPFMLNGLGFFRCLLETFSGVSRNFIIPYRFV